MEKSLSVIISGGGTGGHIYPAIAIANEVKLRFPEANILFVGAKDKMEYYKTKSENYVEYSKTMEEAKEFVIKYKDQKIKN